MVGLKDFPHYGARKPASGSNLCCAALAQARLMVRVIALVDDTVLCYFDTMRKRFWFSILVIFWLGSFQAINASVIDDNAPNPMVVGKAFGFMLFGNDGFMRSDIEELAVDGCKVSYEIDGGIYAHAIQRMYVSYDLNKANWRSAVYQPDYVNDVVIFEIYGDAGLREIRYDHTFENEDELRLGIVFLGLTVGPQNNIKIQLPTYMTKERYDRAFLDLTAQCPGSQGGY